MIEHHNPGSYRGWKLCIGNLILMRYTHHQTSIFEVRYLATKLFF